ncbi:MAG: putative lipid II flippase FtsW [Pseudomonadota bacterium]
MASRADRSPLSQWLWTVDKKLLVSLLLLMVMGLILSPAASPPVAERIGADTFHFVKRHAFYMIPALAVLIGTSFMTPRQVRRSAALLLAVSLLLMIATLFFGFEVKGARRWIQIAGFSIQPSEFLKPAFVVICAWLFAESITRPDVPGNLFAMILLAMVVALLVAQPDLGQTILVVCAWGALLFLAGISWRWISALAVFGLAGMISAYFFFYHVALRINRFITGEGDNFQTDRSIKAVVEGGWLGQGPGEGVVKRGLPDSHADFAFAVLAEEFGIIACMVVVALFAFIVLRALSHALTEPDPFPRLAVGGLTVLFGAQSFINIGVNLKLLPAKGMTLPFLSYGGSSMIAVAFGMGLVLALTRERPDRRASHRSLRDLSFTAGRQVDGSGTQPAAAE